MNSHSSSETQQNKLDNCARWDGFTLAALFKAGTSWIERHIDELNSIDVFPPPPSGSAGIRIYLTLLAGCREIEGQPHSTASEVARTFAHGTLIGARGHQGVPFSLWFRGFARAIDEKAEINADVFADALMEAAATTYRAYINPIKGDMWSVAKNVAEAAKRAAEETADLCYVLRKAIEEAERSVDRTTELIPILKEVGVVHAGGLALFYFLDGMNRYLDGEVTVNSLSYDDGYDDEATDD